jgi:hypothetical protein
VEELLTNLGLCRKSLQGNRRHPGLQFKIELIKQVSLGLEVREQRGADMEAGSLN